MFESAEILKTWAQHPDGVNIPISEADAQKPYSQAP